MKVIKTADGRPLPGSESQAEQSNLSFVRQYATNLRNLTNTFTNNLGKFESDEQALMVLEQIQTIVEKLVGSIQQGRRKNYISTPEAVDQARTPLG